MTKTTTKTIYIRKIWVDTNLSIEGSPTGHNSVVFLINSLYLASPTRSSRALDWMSDPTDNFGIITIDGLIIFGKNLFRELTNSKKRS